MEGDLSPVGPERGIFYVFAQIASPVATNPKKFWRKYLEYCPIRCIFAMSIRTNNV